MIRLGTWFAVFMAVGLGIVARFDLDLGLNGVAIVAGILALLATGIGGVRRSPHRG